MPATTSLQTVAGADRKFLIAAALLFGVMMILGIVAGPEDPDRFPPNSAYSAKKTGAKAAFLLLQQMGFTVEHWERPLADLEADASDSARTLLILDAPRLPASKLGLSEEKDALNAFLMRGGRVLALGPESASILPEVKWVEPEADAKRPLPAKRYAATAESSINWHSPSIEMRPSGFPQLKAESKVEHYEGPAVISYRIGKGEVIVWADSKALSNSGLDRAGNLQLLLNSVGSAAGTRILWDEHFHGERQGLLAYFTRTPAPWLILQFLIVFAATIVTFSRRHGPLVELRPGGSRLSPLEFVETLGDLYHRKRAAAEALEISWHRFHASLTRRLGLPPQTGARQIALAVAERWAWRDPGFLTMLQSCEHAVRVHDVTEKDALRLIGEMHNRAIDWRLVPIRSGEKRTGEKRTGEKRTGEKRPGG
jgi:hypothetical protein